MALTLENVNEQVNSNLEAQAPTLTAEVVATADAKRAPATPADDELMRLRSENEELKRAATAAQAEAEGKMSDLRIKAAIATAHKPAASLRSGQAAVSRSQAISKVGGLAFWMKLPVAERCAILGVPDSASIADKTIQKYFGSSSGSRAATELANSDTASYSRLKIVAIERGIY
jgi:hypothetical protein